VLMIDGFDKNGQSPQLSSQQFYEDCYQAMLPNGIMVINLLEDMLDTLNCIGRIDDAFKGATIVINAIESTNIVVFACKGNALDMTDEALKARISELESQYPVALRLTAQSIFQERRSTKKNLRK
jgi:spermidine synthase